MAEGEEVELAAGLYQSGRQGREVSVACRQNDDLSRRLELAIYELESPDGDVDVDARLSSNEYRVVPGGVLAAAIPVSAQDLVDFHSSKTEFESVVFESSFELFPARIQATILSSKPKRSRYLDAEFVFDAAQQNFRIETVQRLPRILVAVRTTPDVPSAPSAMNICRIHGDDAKGFFRHVANFERQPLLCSNSEWSSTTSSCCLACRPCRNESWVGVAR